MPTALIRGGGAPPPPPSRLRWIERRPAWSTQLRARGAETALVSARVNRRKIDLIPVAAWSDPTKARIGELLVAVTDRLAAAGISGLSEVVALAMDAARAEGLTDPRITSDGKHVEIGLTDKSDSARWAAQWLCERGVTGGLILVGGDELGPLGGVPGSDAHLLIPELTRATVVSVGAEPGGVPPGVLHVGGGPDRLLELLDGQLARRMDRRVPSVDDDPAWVVALPRQDAMGRVAESIGALANGGVGLRATREEDGSATLPLFIVNGIYTRGAEPHLLPGPLWTNLDVRGTGGDERLLDLRTGVLLRTDGGPSQLRSLRFLSAADPELMALRAEGSADHLQPGTTFALPTEPTAVEHDDRGAVRRARTTDPGGGGIAVAARDWQQVVDARRVVERLASWEADAFRAPTWAARQREPGPRGGAGLRPVAGGPPRRPGPACGPAPRSASTARARTSWPPDLPCSTCWGRHLTEPRPLSAPGG